MIGPLKKIEFHHEGFNEVRRSAPVKAVLESWGQRMVDEAGPEDFEWSAFDGRARSRVTVRASTHRGRVLEAGDKVLTQAFGNLGG